MSEASSLGKYFFSFFDTFFSLCTSRLAVGMVWIAMVMCWGKGEGVNIRLSASSLDGMQQAYSPILST